MYISNQNLMITMRKLLVKQSNMYQKVENMY